MITPEQQELRDWYWDSKREEAGSALTRLFDTFFKDFEIEAKPPLEGMQVATREIGNTLMMALDEVFKEDVYEYLALCKKLEEEYGEKIKQVSTKSEQILEKYLDENQEYVVQLLFKDILEELGDADED